ncbi:protein FAR1-RELATED SEQUENCE 5-like [Chenopodium quinoa]|uniref:protein FAR1-RELATED SEQUENCE 5-like n=1 Tax=Chenopodium quinoa TaxID=63459 RepID=UPI000B7741DA|nr:protein FAR1-RELATED SEQUENCE 5-like [Chenopodium quinoa]
MFTYFQSMVEDNPNFFYTYRVDEEGRLKDVIWVDARCRMAYEEFGDVVCFDSTYLTNEYKLPFCNFVGVNHHGQTILFGCALVNRETAETFECVFSNWLRCMENKTPVAILADQDPSMRKALKTTMKGTTHRWCIWHILQKISTKLGKHPKYPELKEELESVVYDSLDCEEFERRWQEVIKKHKCEMDEWLEGPDILMPNFSTVCRLYDERHMWIPAFVKHLFWAGMKTTQRVESIHSFFDGYLSRHTLLSEFVERYCEALEVRAISEKRADDNNSRFVRQPMTSFPAESVFRKIYTDAKFKEVQRECSRLLYVTGLEKRQLSDTMIEHVLEDIVWFKPKNSRKEVPSQRKRVYKVTYNRSTKEADCECRYFHCHGIMCRHMIMVYQMNDCTEIPDKYILRRWRKDVIRKHTRVKVKYHDPSKTEAVCRFDKMMVKFSPICSKASICKSAFDVVLNGLQLLDIQVEEKLSMMSRNRSDLMGCNGTPSSVCLEKEAPPPSTEKQGSCAKDLSLQLATIKDPPILKKPSHRTTDSRYKTCIEKSKKPGKKKQVTAAGGGSLNNPQSSFPQEQHSFPMMGYSPHCVGGIQMKDRDGSLGYFTSLSGVQRPPSVGAAFSPTQRPLFPPYYMAFQQFCQMQGFPMQMDGYMSPNTAMSQFPYQLRPAN